MIERPNPQPPPPVARHILDARQFTRDWIEKDLFPVASRLQETPPSELPKPLLGRRLFYLFYEPSTRTRLSFETAVTLLGGTVTGMDSFEHRPEEERLEDRIRILNEYLYDFILLRYHQEGGARRAAAVSRVPVINAGDGTGQHPTQALLDCYTLWREFGRIDGLRLALVGDLSNERSVNSLAFLLGRFTRLKVYLVSPQYLRLRDDARSHLTESGADVAEVRDLRSVAGDVDAIYITQAHSARLEHARRFDNSSGSFDVDDVVMGNLPSHGLVLHPLPRGPELPETLDHDKRVACFRQAQNGLFVRMALLTLLAHDEGVT